MFETPQNQRTVSLKLKRGELCDLMLACASIEAAAVEGGTQKWSALHEKLKSIIDAFDAKQDLKA